MQAAGPKRPPETAADPKKAPKMVKVSGTAKKEKYVLTGGFCKETQRVSERTSLERQV